MAGLRVGLACGVLLLPGFGVSSSSPQVPGHPTSICDAGVKGVLCNRVEFNSGISSHLQVNRPQTFKVPLK